MVQRQGRPDGHVWMAAQQFFKAAELLIENPQQFGIPAIVNYAFAAELAMKAAHIIVAASPPGASGLVPAATKRSTARVPGHDLSKIFAALEPNIQLELSRLFQLEIGQDLTTLLAKCGNYFGDGRYYFEKASAAFAVEPIYLVAKGLLAAVHQYGLAREGAIRAAGASSTPKNSVVNQGR